MTRTQWLKQKIWNVLYPIWPWLEHKLLFLHHHKRQKYHIGWLAPQYTVEELKHHLSTRWGFGNHFVAWEDHDQILSWRKLNSFQQQYHLRVFSDGEIRGHFEYTPEAAPLSHLFKSDQSPRTQDFLKFLGPCVTIHKHISHLHIELVRAKHEAEITFMK